MGYWLLRYFNENDNVNDNENDNENENENDNFQLSTFNFQLEKDGKQ